MYLGFFGAVLAACVLFYLLIYPLKRFFGSLCSPLETLSAAALYKVEQETEKRVRAEQIMELHKSIVRYPQLIKIVTIYLVIGYVSSMGAGGVVYLVNTAVPYADLQTNLIRKVILFGGVFGVLSVGISRVSAICYSILPLRLLLFYFGGVASFLMVYAAINPEAFTRVTDLAIKPLAENLLIFVLVISLGIALSVELLLNLAKKKWSVARRTPIQLTTEIRESYEEQEYVLGYEEVNRLISDTFTIQTLEAVDEILWVTLDGPVFFAEMLERKLSQNWRDANCCDKDGKSLSMEEYTKRKVKVICPYDIAQRLRVVLQADYRCPKDESKIGNFRFIIFNRKRAVIYFPIPYADLRPANVAQLITLPYRIYCIRSHFFDWWRNSKKIG